MWGRQDGLVPVLYAQEFQQRIPEARLRIIDDASHLVSVEKTGEVLESGYFNGKIRFEYPLFIEQLFYFFFFTRKFPLRFILLYN
ncbi:alpha/beta fold hydrolase [Brevibacillus sp. NRS-1366]|uniref:alpha/beta fold hydrolase n=1 Tax=Brevibacillus sp. NRS-1366 TaxID=3233899 RepID=UPI003D1E7361